MSQDINELSKLYLSPTSVSLTQIRRERKTFVHPSWKEVKSPSNKSQVLIGIKKRPPGFINFMWGGGVKLQEIRRELFPHIKISKISAGSYHFIALDENGIAYTWGEGKLGQLCLGEGVRSVATPKRLNNIGKVSEIWAGFCQSALLLEEENKLFFFGAIGNNVFFEGRNYPIFDMFIIKQVVFSPSSVGSFLLFIFNFYFNLIYFLI